MPREARRSLQPRVDVALLAAVLAIVAAIAVPNALSALDRKRQKQTMTQMRTIGTALGEYQIDHEGYPPGHGGLDVIRDALPLRLAAHIRDEDAWGHPYRYDADLPTGARLATTYTLVSLGRDGVAQGMTSEITRSFDCDIVYVDGQFHQAPMGECLAEGSRLELPGRSPLPVQDARPGLRVMGQALDGPPGEMLVEVVRVHHVSSLLDVTVEGGTTLGITPEHPVGTPGGWRAAGLLAPGDAVITTTGVKHVTAVRTRSGPVRVYDLQVSGAHAFFAEGVLVHNKKL